MPNCVTINGKGSTHFYSSTPGPMQVMKLTADSSSKPSCGFCEAEPNGDCFRKNMGTGIVSTNALRVGVSTRCGKICINILPMTRIWRIFYWTAPSCERILAPQERQKKRRAGKPGPRAQSGRVQHQDPRQCRCPGQSTAVSPDRRATS